jgi:hypothetical protein
VETNYKDVNMAISTESNRNTALQLLELAGKSWKRIGKGQRFVIQVDRSGETISALVKVASKGSAMVRTDVDDAEEAKISGFTDDVRFVFFAIGNPKTLTVSAYLVPIEEVEAAYRASHRKWRDNHPTGTENTTWVLWFNDSGDADCNGYHRKWEHYRIGESDTPMERTISADKQGSVSGLSIEEAKVGLARRFNVDPANVKIVIEY